MKHIAKINLVAWDYGKWENYFESELKQLQEKAGDEPIDVEYTNSPGGSIELKSISPLISDDIRNAIIKTFKNSGK